MTTPAITELLDTLDTTLRCGGLTFDERVGYLTARHFDKLPSPALRFSERASMIRDALIERNSARLRELNHQQPAPEQPAREPRPARDLQAEIDSERVAIATITRRGIFAGPALENLQLHINRLVALEKKARTQ